MAYVQLYAPDKYPNVTLEIPKAAIKASCDTDRFTLQSLFAVSARPTLIGG